MIGDKSDGPYSPSQNTAFGHLLFVDHNLGDFDKAKDLIRRSVSNTKQIYVEGISERFGALVYIKKFE